MERTNDYLVAALYRFVHLPHYAELRPSLLARCEAEGLVGSILLAEEGINGTIAGSELGIEAVLDHLRRVPALRSLEVKRSWCDEVPFHRMKVRLKREIVSMGDPEIDPTTRVGTYVDPRAFDRLLSDPEVTVVDTRNAYEVRVGTFEGAIDPGIASFRDFPRWARENLDPARHRKVAMFCTGGIRCEKATSLLLREGFEEVYHLEGGILKYLEATPPSESRWIGECFVFDKRTTVDAELKPGQCRLCFGCLEPVTPEDQAHEDYEYGVQCPRCSAQTTDADRARRRERLHQIALAEVEGRSHIGARLEPKAEGEVVPPPDGVLYSFRRCPYAMRARMALAAGGFDPELREVELKAKPVAMLALGTTVPILQLPDGTVLPESLPIMRWVRAQRPEAMAYREGLEPLLEMIDGPFKRALDRAKYPIRFPDEDCSGARQEAEALLGKVETALGEDSFLDGPEAGFHDAAVFPFVRQFAGIDLERFDRLCGLQRVVRWRERMANHPWFQSVMRKLPVWKPHDPPLSFQRTLR